ncbi:GntR family transcriptional regulator [Marinomonas sp. 2405UD68-3]|uniref:GntR family transcriptional regulator n=1 Tax=Marinomonas sp. 2405UD68-3 TaxID=3391835 RepID=UPI0039C9152F
MTEFLYQNLIDWFQEQLAKGAFVAGDKMPSLRSVAKEQGVSLNTVIHGYEVLVKEGWIESQPKSGYFVCHRSQLRAAIPILSDVSQTLTTAALLPFDQRAFNQTALTGQVHPLMKSDLFTLGAKSQTAIGQGDKAVLDGVNEHLTALGIQSKSDSIWLGSSAQAIFTQAVQQLTKVKDKVLVIAPCDYRLTQTLLDLGRVPVVVTAGNHGVDLDLARACIKEQKIRLVVLPGQFSLPAGQLISNLSLRRWIALLDEQNLLAIEWDMSSCLSYKGKWPITYKSLDTQGRVLYIGAFEHFDQYGNDIAWVLLDGKFASFNHVFFAAQLTPSLGVQNGFLQGVKQNLNRKLNGLARAIWRKSERIKAQLDSALGEKVSVMLAKGGRFLWLRFDASLTGSLDSALEIAKTTRKSGLLSGKSVFYENGANEWLALNLTTEELDTTVLWLIETLTKVEEVEPVVAVDDSESDTLGADPTETSETPSKKPPECQEEIEPVYNPMLDLINHDFG